VNAENKSKMTLVDELHHGIKILAGPRQWNDTRESWLARGARAAGVSFRTAKGLFYREWPDPRASVVDSVRAAVARQTHQSQTEAKERDALQELRERITLLESRLEKIDPEFFGHALKAFRDAAPRNRRATD
jgi:hypothetical protein